LRLPSRAPILVRVRKRHAAALTGSGKRQYFGLDCRRVPSHVVPPGATVSLRQRRGQLDTLGC
jgi:hypothetical protein